MAKKWNSRERHGVGVEREVSGGHMQTMQNGIDVECCDSLLKGSEQGSA